MYKVEYWFNGKLEKIFSFSTEKKATEFYEACRAFSERSVYNEYRYLGYEEDVLTWSML